MLTLSNRRKAMYRVGAAVTAVSMALVLTACGAGSARPAGQLIARMFSGVRDAADTAAIWGPNLTSESVDSAVLWTAKAREITGLHVLLPGAVAESERLLQTLGSRQSGVATVIGHNESGMLRFADGSVLDIARDVPRDGPILALFSCSSRELASETNAVGLPIDVSTRIAIRTETIFAQRLAKLTLEQASDREYLQSLVDKALAQAKIEYPRTLIIGLGLTGIGIGVPMVGIHILAIDRE